MPKTACETRSLDGEESNISNNTVLSNSTLTLLSLYISRQLLLSIAESLAERGVTLTMHEERGGGAGRWQL